MGLPASTSKATSPLRSPMTPGPVKASLSSLVLPGAALAGLTGLSYTLLTPILLPFLSGVLISVPLHRTKAVLVDAASEAKDAQLPTLWLSIEAVLRFVLGPVYSLLDAYLRVYARLPVRPQSLDDDAGQPWPKFMLKWALRATLVSLAWSSAPFRAGVLLTAATLVTIRFASIHLESDTSAASLPPARLREAWNASITSLLIWSLVIIPSISTAFFVNNLIYSSPELIHAAISFIGNPIPAHSPNPFSVIPDLSVRKLALQYGAIEVRNHVIDAIDSHLAISWPNQNVSCVDAAKIALGGYYVYQEKLYSIPKEPGTMPSTAASQFRARFPQAVEFIELAAYGERIKAFLKLGPAIAEVRWMGPAAFSREAITYEPNVTRESLDPITTTLPGAVPPFLADLAFSSLVFFSTLGTLVYSDLGVLGYLTKLVGKDLAVALIDPLDASFHLNLDLLVYRVCLTHLTSILVFPGNTLALQAVLPFVALIATLMPAVPIFLPLGVVPAIILFVAYGSPWAAAVVMYIQFWWSPEGSIQDMWMGTDGIGVIDGFATWMGWMAVGTPAGLVAGPWGFMALRRVYGLLVDR